jgi:ABC-type polysaccharide/polyol phosphate export permease
VLFVRYRDLHQVWDVAVQAGLFVAPIIYPLDVLPERYHRLVYLWPPSSVIEFSRSVLIDGVLPRPGRTSCGRSPRRVPRRGSARLPAPRADRAGHL